MLFTGQPLSIGERKILEELQAAKDRHEEWVSNKSLSKLPNMFPSNLAKFLKRLRVERGLIERDPETGEYRILGLGLEALKRSDDMGISFASKRAKFRELEPSNDVVAPRIIPVQASVYLNEEIEAAAERVAEEEGLTWPEARDKLLFDLAEQTAYAFEQMLRERFYRLVDNWEVHTVRQMSPPDRNKYFRGFGWVFDGKKVPLGEQERISLEESFRKEKLPAGEPDLSIENILDFEAALIVKVSRTAIMKDLQGTKDRLTLRILSDFSNPDIRTYPDKTMPVMAKAGLITQEEFQAYHKAKRTRDRENVLRKLWDAYFLKAWGKEPEKVKIYKV